MAARKHVLAVANVIHDAGCGCAAGPSGETCSYARLILDTEDDRVLNAMVDTLTRRGVLEWEAPFSAPHMRRLVSVEWTEAGA